MLGMGHESLTSIVTPRAFNLRELEYILSLVHFWCSLSVSREVLVSSKTNKLDWDLLILLCKFKCFFVN